MEWAEARLCTQENGSVVIIVHADTYACSVVRRPSEVCYAASGAGDDRRGTEVVFQDVGDSARITTHSSLRIFYTWFSSITIRNNFLF